MKIRILVGIHSECPWGHATGEAEGARIALQENKPLEPLCCTPETKVTLYINYTSIFFFLKRENKPLWDTLSGAPDQSSLCPWTHLTSPESLCFPSTKEVHNMSLKGLCGR